MRWDTHATLPTYAATIGDSRPVWAESCARAAALCASWRDWTGSPHDQMLLETTAILVYGLARRHNRSPDTIGQQELRDWLIEQAAAGTRRRDGIADMLRDAGHATPEPGRATALHRTGDPVADIWHDLTAISARPATIDGTHGLSVEDGLATVTDALA